jgi:hypothetical protein
MARTTLLDDLVEKRICDALRQGHSYEAAVRVGGIVESTFHEWVACGRGTELRRSEMVRYAAFAERVSRADHEAEDRAVAVLSAALTGDDMKLATDTAWKWLARRRPATWAERKGEEQERELSDEETRTEWKKLTGTEWK